MLVGGAGARTAGANGHGQGLGGRQSLVLCHASGEASRSSAASGSALPLLIVEAAALRAHTRLNRAGVSQHPPAPVAARGGIGDVDTLGQRGTHIVGEGVVRQLDNKALVGIERRRLDFGQRGPVHVARGGNLDNASEQADRSVAPGIVAAVDRVEGGARHAAQVIGESRAHFRILSFVFFLDHDRGSTSADLAKHPQERTRLAHGGAVDRDVGGNDLLNGQETVARAAEAFHLTTTAGGGEPAAGVADKARARGGQGGGRGRVVQGSLFRVSVGHA